MRLLHLPLALAAAALALAARPSPAARCSLVPFTSWRMPDATHLVGRALPDTVAAGEGGVRTGDGPGHWGAGAPRTAHGQVVRVDSLGGFMAEGLAAAFARSGAREVVIVPWDYGPSCEPVPWARSARWVETDAPAFFSVRPRPESLWVAGRPVLDAFAADLDAYPHGLAHRPGSGDASTSRLHTEAALTAEEMFGLFASLPVLDRASMEPSPDLGPLEAWARAHPEIAARFPAADILRGARARRARRARR